MNAFSISAFFISALILSLLKGDTSLSSMRYFCLYAWRKGLAESLAMKRPLSRKCFLCVLSSLRRLVSFGCEVLTVNFTLLATGGTTTAGGYSSASSVPSSPVRLI